MSLRITIAAVGRARRGPERALFDDYAARLSWPVSLKEIDARVPGSTPAAVRIADEGARLIAAVPPGALVVALDERGQDLSSEAFAEKIRAWRDGGRRDLAFVIGGAGGLADAVRERAILVLALGRPTWPHLLVRAMVAEQLYRAQQILAGHPYHRA